jgi:hypothetical protein
MKKMKIEIDADIPSDGIKAFGWVSDALGKFLRSLGEISDMKVDSVTIRTEKKEE